MSRLTLYFPDSTGFEKAKSILDDSGFDYDIGTEEDLEETGKKILGEKKPTLVVEAFEDILVDHQGNHAIEKALEELDFSNYPSTEEELEEENYQTNTYR